MSRGLGELQLSICNYLAANPAPATYETLRWELFEQRRHADGRAGLHDGRLPSTWNTSLKRALDGLVERGKRPVRVEHRHLASMQEFVRHYPGKSLIASTRKLRVNRVVEFVVDVDQQVVDRSSVAAALMPVSGAVGVQVWHKLFPSLFRLPASDHRWP